MSEQTYRNPLFGRRVDRYIPPELRQGLGALLAGADMLNPFSALYDYRVAMSRGEYPEAAAHALGFAAPGIGAALASKVARPAASAVAPYADDAARVLMEILTPTGAPDIQAAGRNAPRGMSRREFLGGLGAVGTAAATAKLPVDEMLEGLGRAGARGGGRLGAGLSGLRSLRDSILSVNDLTSSDEGMIYTLNREISDLRGGYFDNELVPREVTERISSLESELSALSDKLSGPRAQRQDLLGNYSSARDDLFGDVVANTDDFISEIGDLSDEDLSELGSQLAQYVANPSNVSRLKRSGYEPSEIVSSFGRISGKLREEAVRRDLGGNVLDDVEYLLSDGLPELEYLYRVEGSQPRYSADFGSMLPDVTSRMVGGGDDFGRGLGDVRISGPEGAKVKPIIGEAFDDWIDRIYSPSNRGAGNVVQDENVVFRAMSPKEAEVGEESGVFRDVTGSPLYVANDPERYIGGGAYGGKRQGRIYEFDVTGLPSRIRQGGVGIQERAIDEIPAGRVRRVWEWDPEAKAHKLITDNTRGPTRPD